MAAAQDEGWTHWGGDERSTRYTPFDQIDADNFEDLEVAWLWRGDNYGPSVDNVMRSTPIYAEGKLFGVAGYRRTVIAMDPATGETLWTFREPSTKRWEDSMRKNYGKGVAYEVVNGEGRIYVVTPGFFLHALDPDTRVSDRELRRQRDGRPAGRLRLRVPPDRRHAVDRRLHHQLLAADRRQWGGRGRQLARAGLPADPAGKRAGAHPGL